MLGHRFWNAHNPSTSAFYSSHISPQRNEPCETASTHRSTEPRRHQLQRLNLRSHQPLQLCILRRVQHRFEPLPRPIPVSYTHLRAHETRHDLVCRLLLEKKNNINAFENSFSLLESIIGELCVVEHQD